MGCATWSRDTWSRTPATGTTGHAEVTRIYYDPAVISYETLLDWLWRSKGPDHLEPTGRRQRHTVPPAIFYHNAAQQQAAEASKQPFKRPSKT